MDEILFHLGRTYDLLQIWLYEVSQRTNCLALEAENYVVSLASTPKLIVVKETVSESWCLVKEAFTNSILACYRLAEPDYLKNAFSNYIGQEFNRATIFACCLGFTVGSSLGLAIGICLQSPRQHHPIMRAIAATSFDPDAIIVLEDAFVPKLYKPNQILVNVKFASLSILDISAASGHGRSIRNIINRGNPNYLSELPLILGQDGSGVVVETGSESKFKINNKVYFHVSSFESSCAAEYALIDSCDAALIPDMLDFESAASFPSAAITAWRSVVLKAGLTSKNAHSKKVFVHCGSTWPGWMLVQLAASFKSTVVTSSTNKAKSSLLLSGAEKVLTIDSGELSEHNDRYDIVFNTEDGKLADEFCQNLCTPNGKVISVKKPKPLGVLSGALFSFWISFSGLFGAQFWRPKIKNGTILEEINRLVENKRIKPNVEKIYRLQDIDDAIHRLANETSTGAKLIRFENLHKD